MRNPKLEAPLLMVVLALALSACGGGGSSSSHSQTTASSSATSSAQTSMPPSTITTGPVHATLKGENHAPRVGKLWRYTVRVSDARGKPLSGKVDVEFALGSLVVGHDTPPVHALRHGMVQEALTFPPAAVGHAIALQTVVHTKAGSVTLDWPVTATR